VVITQNKKGYSRHPETSRWRSRLAALYLRHKMLVSEMQRRGYIHKSSLDPKLATGFKNQPVFIDSPKEQEKILKKKNCGCAF
jgi:hypothetical protein